MARRRTLVTGGASGPPSSPNLDVVMGPASRSFPPVWRETLMEAVSAL